MRRYINLRFTFACLLTYLLFGLSKYCIVDITKQTASPTVYALLVDDSCWRRRQRLAVTTARHSRVLA